MGNADSAQTKKLSSKTIPTLNLEEYTGLWYSVALIPKTYTRNCKSSVAAYFIVGSSLNITNYCVSNDEVKSVVNGIAKIIDLEDPGKLSVKFDGSFSDGMYWIYDTDYKNYSIVGGGSLDSLWILSRTPTIKSKLLKELLDKAHEIGYSYSDIVTRGDAIM